MTDKIHPSWKPLFDTYSFDFEVIYKNDHEDIIYPPQSQLFRIFEMNVLDIQVVLLGQDPYHEPGQAHGFAFSVPDGVKIPPSLRNIYKELLLEFPERNYQFLSGNLEQWVYREGIFLLNTSLCVKKGTAGSHMKMWEEFTNDVIKYICEKNSTCIFLLLGNFAIKKSEFIQDKTRIITEKHPSPLARGFIGSNVFIRVENALGKEINWSIS